MHPGKIVPKLFMYLFVYLFMWMTSFHNNLNSYSYFSRVAGCLCLIHILLISSLQ